MRNALLTIDFQIILDDETKLLKRNKQYNMFIKNNQNSLHEIYDLFYNDKKIRSRRQGM